MEKVNYILHLNAVFEEFRKDTRLNATHITLYVGLFQLWNLYKFKERFFVDRNELMKLSKIGSKNTYHKCIKELNHWKYIRYLPSHNPFKGSEVIMPKFGTSGVTPANQRKTVPELAQGSKVKLNKTKINLVKGGALPTKNEIFIFFATKKWPVIEGEKFFLYYQGLGWKMRGNMRISDWKALAEKWMIRVKEDETNLQVSQKWDNLSTPKDTNYAEPL